jgi:hypothetical protein
VNKLLVYNAQLSLLLSFCVLVGGFYGVTYFPYLAVALMFSSLIVLVFGVRPFRASQ